MRKTIKLPKIHNFIECGMCGEQLYFDFILASDFDKFMNNWRNWSKEKQK